jgi:putative transposase
MLQKKTLDMRSKEEKERILLDIQKIGIVAGCRKYNINKTSYYDWLERYNASGLSGLEDRRSVRTSEAQIKRLEKELALTKTILAEKEIELRLKDDLLKKRIAQWKNEKKS